MVGRTRRKGRARRKPELSQHFIKSAETAKRLVALADLHPTDLVVEAGPGNGRLTAPLAAAASRVIAVEADLRLYRRLKNQLQDTSNVTLRPGDFLKFRLPAGHYTFFANIPYARTADIVRKLVFGKSPPKAAYVIMEAVAATRFLGQPFGPESSLSLMLKARFHPSIIASLQPNSFDPPPSVNSVMLRLRSHDSNLLHRSELRPFDTFARAVFKSPHRSGRNSISKLLPQALMRPLVADLGFPATSPPSNISFEHWFTAFKLLERNRQHDR